VDIRYAHLPTQETKKVSRRYLKLCHLKKKEKKRKKESNFTLFKYTLTVNIICVQMGGVEETTVKKYLNYQNIHTSKSPEMRGGLN